MRNTPRATTGRLLACALVIACADTGDDARITSVDEFPPLALEEELRIGSVDDPDIGFSHISMGSLRVEPDGTMWVYDLLARQIRAYAEDGTFLVRLGATGDGPGEYRGVREWGLHGDTVWLFDSSNTRISYFLRDGSALGNFRVEPHTVAATIYESGDTRAGQLSLRPVNLRSDGFFDAGLASIAFPIVQSMDSITHPQYRFTIDGVPRDGIGTSVIRLQRGENERSER